MIFTDEKKCFIDKDFHFTEDENNALAFVNILPNNMVEIVFLTPIAKNLNRYEAIEQIEQIGKKLGCNAKLPSHESCSKLNSLRSTPLIKSCHIDVSRFNVPVSKSIYFYKINRLGKLKLVDTKEFLENVYLAIEFSLVQSSIVTMQNSLIELVRKVIN